jgi:single-strand DNA-binding protein
MENLNIVIFDGNLTSDPQHKNVGSDYQVCQFTVAVNGREYKEKKPVTYVAVETWGKLAEICSKHLKKGAKVIVHGSLKEERWNDTDGKSRSRMKVRAETVRFESTVKRDQGQASTDQAPEPEPYDFGDGSDVVF